MNFDTYSCGSAQQYKVQGSASDFDSKYCHAGAIQTTKVLYVKTYEAASAGRAAARARRWALALAGRGGRARRARARARQRARARAARSGGTWGTSAAAGTTAVSTPRGICGCTAASSHLQ